MHRGKTLPYLSSYSPDTRTHAKYRGDLSTHFCSRDSSSRAKRLVMSRPDGRKTVRGVETRIFSHVWRASTPQEWASWLRVPLESAASLGDIVVAQKLVEAGAEIGTAVHEAIWSRHDELVEYLLGSPASAASKDENKRTPLHIAALIGSERMVRLLLLKGADVESLDKRGETPILKASQHGEVSVVRVLLGAGASVSIRSTSDDASPLDWAAYEGHMGVLRVLIEHGMDVDSTSSKGYSALHRAAEHNQVEAIDLLVASGADIEAYTDENEELSLSVTPLLCSAIRWNVEALRRLLHHGADANSDDACGTSLHRAVNRAGNHGTAEIVDLLLRSGADETIENRHEETPVGEIEYRAELDGRTGGSLARNEDFDRVRKLLANAPADRTWRRRGFLVLCRAYPDRVHLLAGMAPRTRSRARLARANAGGVDPQITTGSNDIEPGGSWPGVVNIVLGLAEEGVFRKIVRFL